MHPIVKPVGLGCLLPAALFSGVVARDVWVDGRRGPFGGPEPLLVIPCTSNRTADAGVGDLDGDSHAEFGILDELEEVDRLHVDSTASWTRSLVLADDGLWISSARTTKDENEDGIRDLLVGARNGRDRAAAHGDGSRFDGPRSTGSRFGDTGL